MIQYFRKRWQYHLLIWVSSYIGLVFLDYFSTNNMQNLSESLLDPIFFFLPILPTTYLSFWAKEKFFDTRKYFLYFITAVVIVFLGVYLYEFLEKLEGELKNTRGQNIINFIFLQVFVVGLQYFKRGIVNQYQLQELKAKTAETELNALKAQLNPHFLFNTLNNIYGVNQSDAELGSELIMELSDVMRYHLEFSKMNNVKLDDEIQLLNSYIKLEKLRLMDTCRVSTNFSDVDDGLMIPPLLMLPFVENAFKHGTHPTRPCYVDINIKSNGDKFIFKVSNSMINNKKVVKTNIGLANTKRRLKLLFPDKHELKIDKGDKEHVVELSLELWKI